jgi:hypothetical protein
MAYKSAKLYHNVKRGYWNGKWYDSSWELALIVYCHNHNIELTRNTRKFPYKWYNHTEYYQPDFILADGTYIEVKGIKDNKTKRKLEYFPYPIKIYGHKEMKPYLKYMDETYGKNWRNLF